MRIPSQFNDSSLYRRPDRGQGGQKGRVRVSPDRAAGNSWRKTFRMAVALLLVVAMMQQARKPGFYSPFFQSGEATESWESVPANPLLAESPADRTDEQGVAADSIDLAAPSKEGFAGEEEIPWPLASTWVASMEVSLQQAWIKLLIRKRYPKRSFPPGEPLSGDQLQTSLRRLDDLADTTRATQAVRQAIEQIAADGPFDWQSNRWWADAVLRSLGQEAITRVVDGTFWVGADSDAFYLQLLQADEHDEAVGIKVGTLPLLTQPQSYQGKAIRLEGRLGVAQRVTSDGNDYGISEYWKLWVVPDDGGLRPTLLIVSSLPDGLQAGLKPDGRWSKLRAPHNPEGELRAIGRFIKRLPYRSEAGADLSPVVVGRVVAVRDRTHRDGDAAKTDAASQQDLFSGLRSFGGLGMVIVMTAIAGVAIAGGLFYRTSVEWKRSRALRQKTSSIDFGSLDAMALADAASDQGVTRGQSADMPTADEQPEERS